VKAILLLNSDGSLTRWQAAALQEAKRSGLSISGILLTASQNKRKVHSGVVGYYAIASLAQVGNPWTKRQSSTEVLDNSLWGVPRILDRFSLDERMGLWPEVE
jgi:hypothetical protein